jgi:hypothetical protein
MNTLSPPCISPGREAKHETKIECRKRRRVNVEPGDTEVGDACDGGRRVVEEEGKPPRSASRRQRGRCSRVAVETQGGV